MRMPPGCRQLVVAAALAAAAVPAAARPNPAPKSCGNVGGGVAKLLLQHPERMTARAGRRLELRRVVVQDLNKQRAVNLPPGILATELRDVLTDPQIQVVVEVVGGTGYARRAVLEALAHGWGCEITQDPDGTLSAATSHDENRKAIDPVSVAAAVLSIPSAALAVADLADRIHKRRRARELIDHAQQLADQHVTVRLVSQGHTAELRTMAPDQLLELLAGEDAP